MAPDLLNRADIAALLARLGYSNSQGLVPAREFDKLTSNRITLVHAARYMNCYAAFGLRSPTRKVGTFTPLVLLCTAQSDDEVRTIHRRAWSQGLVPFVLVTTAEAHWLCNGFAFRNDEANHGNTRWRIKSPDLAGNTEPIYIKLHARSLRSSISWRDAAALADERVDQSLLDNLDKLAARLTKKAPRREALSSRLAHLLIGRFLYLLMIIDRGYVDEEWFRRRGHQWSDFLQSSNEWNPQRFFALVKDLDRVFNGGIFSIPVELERQIGSSHLVFIRDVMRFGLSLSVAGDQLSFLEIDFQTLRVETLSAVYELFLSRAGSHSRRRKAAFYTPPHLVDYVMDLVEEHGVQFKRDTRILDPTSGSGVFLVASYRRMIESYISGESPKISAPHHELKRLLESAIFGIELEPEACDVTAFSLYLTLLDYIDRQEVRRLIESAEQSSNTIFPDLRQGNVIAADVFDEMARFADLPKFDVVVANPPWGKPSQVGTEAMRRVAKLYKPEIGAGQAAEIVATFAMDNFLSAGGLAAFVVPASSLSNDASALFRHRLAKDTVLYVTNLSHFRRTLFRGAEQAAATILVRKQQSPIEHVVTVHSPLKTHQPARRILWTLTIDRAGVEYIRQGDMVDERRWARVLNGRPIDRIILDHVERGITNERFAFLKNLEPAVLVKQGDKPRFTGIPNEMMVTSKKSADNFYLNVLGKRPQLRLEVSRRSPIYPLPRKFQALVREGFTRPFSGEVVIIPRRIGLAMYVPSPVAFGSTFIGIYGAESNEKKLSRSREFLHSIERFLNTEIAQYFLTIEAPSASMDRPRLSIDDIYHLPIFFKGDTDPRWRSFMNADESQSNEIAYREFGIDGVYRKAVREFLNFRQWFRNANVPAGATNRPNRGEISAYLDVLRNQLLFGNQVGVKRSDEYVGELWGSYLAIDLSGLISSEPTEATSSLFSRAGESFDHSAESDFTNSLFICRDRNTANFVAIKPARREHWTIERAFSDAGLLSEKILEEG